MLDRLHGRLNPRQDKALRRLFRAEPEGFEGGLSADNYRRITGAPASTATRDLTDMVAKGALRTHGDTPIHALLPRPAVVGRVATTNAKDI